MFWAGLLVREPEALCWYAICHTRIQTGRQTDTDRQEGSDEQSYIATEQSNGMRYRHVRYGETSIKRAIERHTDRGQHVDI